MKVRAAIVLLAMALSSCKSAGGSSDPAVAAAIFTAIAAGTAVASRAAGGCYASCPTGTTCNEVTGFCEPIPCRGLCTAYERCDVDTNTCVEVTSPTLAAQTEAANKKPVLPAEIEYGCPAIDPETGLPMIPLWGRAACGQR